MGSNRHILMRERLAKIKREKGIEILREKLILLRKQRNLSYKMHVKPLDAEIHRYNDLLKEVQR